MRCQYHNHHCIFVQDKQQTATKAEYLSLTVTCNNYTLLKQNLQDKKEASFSV